MWRPCIVSLEPHMRFGSSKGLECSLHVLRAGDGRLPLRPQEGGGWHMSAKGTGCQPFGASRTGIGRRTTWPSSPSCSEICQRRHPGHITVTGSSCKQALAPKEFALSGRYSKVQLAVRHGRHVQSLAPEGLLHQCGQAEAHQEAEARSRFFLAAGQCLLLRRHCRMWPLEGVLQEKYRWEEAEALEATEKRNVLCGHRDSATPVSFFFFFQMADFLLPMLTWQPSQRQAASEDRPGPRRGGCACACPQALKHAWVQPRNGETDTWPAPASALGPLNGAMASRRPNRWLLK